MIRTFADDRWDDLVAAVGSVREQTVQPREIIVVVDHNPGLLERVRAHFPDVVAVENRERRGGAGALNSGIAVARGQIVANLDDDAIAAPDWLERHLAAYREEHVLGVGGPAEPVWLSPKPAWFPEEYNWVVGCTYPGLPVRTGRVRNIIGANMSIRRDLVDVIGGFRLGLGAYLGIPPFLGCEDTEFCLRANQHWGRWGFVHEPRAKVLHRVPTRRMSWSYFRSVCIKEGRTKALLVRLMGDREGLASERSYTLHLLPRSVVRNLGDVLLRRDPSGLARAGALVAGLAFATAGYLIGAVTFRYISRDGSPVPRLADPFDARANAD